MLFSDIPIVSQKKILNIWESACGTASTVQQSDQTCRLADKGPLFPTVH